MVRPFVPTMLPLLAIALTASSGCAARKGDSGPMAYRFEAADRTFALEYISPPWMINRESAQEIELLIEPIAFGVKLEGSPPTHGVRAGRVDEVAGVADFFGAEFDFGGTGGALDFDIPPGLGDLGLDDLETQGVDVDEIPDYFRDVELDNPREVAIAELNYLVDQQGAELQSSLNQFETRSGQEAVVFETVNDPGVFIRSFYLRTSKTALRVAFVSLFELETDDIDMMAETIETDLGGL